MEKNKRMMRTGFLILMLFCLGQLFAAPCGDVNSSESIDIIDALIIAQYSVGLEVTGFNHSAADVNGDKVVNIIDALQVAQYTVGLIPKLTGCSDCTPTNYMLEAENAEWDSGIIQSEHTGFSGTGYVNMDNAAGHWIEWTLDLSSESGADCSITYAHQTGSRAMEIKVNGSVVETLAFPATGAWTSWSSETSAFNLNTGTNTIRLTSTVSDGAPNIDRIDLNILCAAIVTPTPVPTPTPTPAPSPTPEGMTPPPFVETTIFYASDSTVRHYTPNSNNQQGVGQRLPEFLRDNISIANYAKGGKAISGFLKDGLWDKILAAAQPGDYILIQFGINDRGDVPNKEDFKNYLRRYVEDARAKQAIPVFVTPTPRFQHDDGVFTNAFTKYCEAKFEVGAEMGVTVIDLQTKGRDYFTEIGPSRVDKEMMRDTLHPLNMGAFHLARLLAEGMLESDLIPLKNSVIVENLDPDRAPAVDGWNPREGYTYY